MGTCASLTSLGLHNSASDCLRLARIHSIPLEFLKAISHTIGNVVSTQDVSSSSSEDEGVIVDTPTMGNHCIVCLVPRLVTWVFMPCRHTIVAPIAAKR